MEALLVVTTLYFGVGNVPSSSMSVSPIASYSLCKDAKAALEKRHPHIDNVFYLKVECLEIEHAGP